VSLLTFSELIEFSLLLDNVLVDVESSNNLILQIAAFNLHFTQGLTCAFSNLCTASTCVDLNKRSLNNQ